jgi:hypothetical protein
VGRVLLAAEFDPHFGAEVPDDTPRLDVLAIESHPGSRPALKADGKADTPLRPIPT